MVLLDSNVLLDIWGNDALWGEWSLRHLGVVALRGPPVINSVVYAEISVGYEEIEEIDRLLLEMDIRLANIPREALFLAGKAFQRYRAAGGPRTGVLPDFFIGAHAAAAGVALLTRDVRRYRTYFPTLELIAPDEGSDFAG